MADGDTVFNEISVRGNIIPLDARNLGDKQQARQTVDRSALARAVHGACLEHVETWPELENPNDRIAELERTLADLKRSLGR